ncbi:hypothetical protein [Caproicibacter fermentans]|uniref:DUF5666 domain-containing protein n=1 Tax=Caproicibacter fermentans TaxID=2576756 RepID=A0A7G8TDH6_9FIRM|nr:hypothetical protein [Caproicibacter fermentans]QNK41667.1 hypothetical protein HCR03_05280 [Caproicibacter fermentans]
MTKLNKIQMGTLMLASLCLVGASACSSAQSADSSASAASSSQSDHAASESSAAADQNVVFGKVTAVDGNKITIAVGTLNTDGHSKDRTPGTTQDGSRSDTDHSGKPQSGGKDRPANQSGDQANAASKAPSGGGNGSRPEDGGNRDMLTLTGETKTITISDESILSAQQMMGGPASSGETVSKQTESGEESASLSDIQDGTVLKVTYQSDGETLSSVVILGGKKAN